MKARALMTALWVLSVLGASTACSKETPVPADEQTVAAAPAPPVVAPAPVPENTATKAPLSPPTPKTQPEGLVTPEDLEEEAANTVQLDNLEAELDRLEAEISGGG